MGLDDFVELTKKYAQGIAPSRVMEATGGDDDDDDDVVVKNPDELPLHQKVCKCFVPGLLSFSPQMLTCFYALPLCSYTVTLQGGSKTSSHISIPTSSTTLILHFLFIQGVC